MTIIAITLRTGNEVSCSDVHWDIVHPFSIKSNYLLLANFLHLNIRRWSWRDFACL